jgi:glycerol 2-dehydrogenase (NADP+)
LIKIAEKHNVSPATALISYGVSRGIVVLPKSVTPARIESNLQFTKLDKEDIEELDKLADEGGKQQRITSPPWGTDFVSDYLKAHL